MVMYKGFRAVYLGLYRWRIVMPDNFSFDIKAKNGIGEIIYVINRWRDRGWV